MRRGPAERLVAWLVTGPVGHLWSVVTDITILWIRYGIAKVRGRV
jgi:hypothetical protein